MRGGQTPIHIQRWAPADYQSDKWVKLLLKRRDFLTLTFYRQFIDESFMAGGELPADLETLAACVHMSECDCRKALAFCLNRLIVQRGDSLVQERVEAEVIQELEFREKQGEHGRRGGRPKKKGKPSADEKATLSDTLSTSETPPAPSASALRLAPTPVETSSLVRERGKPPPVPEPGDEVVLHFQAGEELRGEKDYDLCRKKVEEWAEVFPGLDVLAVARSSRQWLRDNPERRKTARGMPKFLHSRLEWLANNGGPNGRPTRQNPRPAHPQSSPDRLARLRERDRLAILESDAPNAPHS